MKRLLCLLVLASVAVLGQRGGQRAGQPAAQGGGQRGAARARGGIRPVPPPGVEVPEQQRTQLQAGVERLKGMIDQLGQNKLLPDVVIYYNAVRYALDNDEFFNVNDIRTARTLLQHGEERANQLLQGRAPWLTQTGLVVRGYVSKIDKSVQPYGLDVPVNWTRDDPRSWRLDTWFHGRSETLSEVSFLNDRENNPGAFSPKNTITLYLYGRYCNASKFAGEVDLFEAMDAVKRDYNIDENRILIRGFSMGGGSAWHIGAHFAGMWAAVAPGAGFSESEQFLHLRPDGPNAPAPWEQTLFHMYDASEYTINLSNTTTIAYNGDEDGQKQAADVVEKEMAELGMHLTRVIGLNMGHGYTPEAKVILDRMLDAAAERGRDPYPRHVRFATYTLLYNQMKWLTVDGLGKHWERATVDADVTGEHDVKVSTQNISAFTFDFGPGGAPLDLVGNATVTIDGQKLTAPPPGSDRSWNVHFRKVGDHWIMAESARALGLQKIHGLQGPIDDAFMDSFIFVTPTGTPMDPGVAPWVASEQDRAIKEWRKQFRGEAQVRKDDEVTAEDVASSNLVLWGDPGSNQVLAAILNSLPITWTAESLTIGGKTYSADKHAPILIFPNPLNPNKYVVLNSGFTFRERAALNNADQTPKLPDYAIIDTSTPPNERWPGAVVQAGFFNEQWGL